MRTLLLLVFITACNTGGFQFTPVPAVETPSEAQQSFAFTSMASNLSPLGCGTQIIRGQWPDFSITEMTQAGACLPVGESYLPLNNHIKTVTADGGIVFYTDTPNIEAGINSGIRHVYFANPSNGSIERISKGLAGAEPNGGSSEGVVSSDGNLICFISEATNIVAGDTNASSDIFLHNRQANTTIRIQAGATEPNDSSLICSLSSDGKFLAFESRASNLVAGDTNGVSDVFIYDIENQTIERASVTSAEAQGVDPSTAPFLSSNGRFVAFVSDQLDGDLDNSGDVFLRDIESGTTHRVTIGYDGSELDSSILYPSVDNSGRFVTFTSNSSNILSSPSSDFYNYIVDRQSNVTKLITKSSGGGYANSTGNTSNISPDGRFVIHNAYATNLITPGTTNPQMFIYDVSTEINHLISRKVDGTQANNTCIIEF